MFILLYVYVSYMYGYANICLVFVHVYTYIYIYLLLSFYQCRICTDLVSYQRAGINSLAIKADSDINFLFDEQSKFHKWFQKCIRVHSQSANRDMVVTFCICVPTHAIWGRGA